MKKPELVMPAEGGSYLRDPKTGELTRQPDEAPAPADAEAKDNVAEEGKTRK